MLFYVFNWCVLIFLISFPHTSHNFKYWYYTKFFFRIMFVICSLVQYCSAVSTKCYKKCFKNSPRPKPVGFSWCNSFSNVFTKIFFWYSYKSFEVNLTPITSLLSSLHQFSCATTLVRHTNSPSPARPAASTTSL